jgi:crossover junction endodeoxyribonuclease RusA
MIISAKGRDYRKSVLQQIADATCNKRVEGNLKVTIEAWRPDKRRRDLDNLFKAALDALAHAGVYDDDSQIVDLRIYWAPTIGGMLKVKIEELK